MLFLMAATAFTQTFVRVEGTRFLIDNKPYFFVGTNYWYGMNLGSKGEGGDRQRLREELDHLCDLGIKNLRIMGACEGHEDEPYRITPVLMSAPGKYNEEMFEGLDFLLDEMAKRDMKAVICLNNFWPWSGGMSQYLAWAKDTKIPYPTDRGGSWKKFMNFTAKFYNNEEANKMFQNHIKTIINRINSINGTTYLNDPTIMAWQLANEPRGMKNERRLNKWIQMTAKYIKSLDKNHLVSVGSEGEVIRKISGNDFTGNHESEFIDYATIHLWVQIWGWYDSYNADSTFSRACTIAKDYIDKHIDLSKELNKPLVLEEFGISRDLNDHDPEAPTFWRDSYFETILSHAYAKALDNSGISGCNIWSWSGSGRPVAPGKMWEKNDAFTGDPPHDLQGWHSVYDNDLSTLDIISKFAKKFDAIVD